MLGVLLLAWVLALASHSANDLAWSTSGVRTGSVAEPLASINLLGHFGALIADFSFYALGYSVFWLPLVGVRAWLQRLAAWLRGAGAPESRRSTWWVVVCTLVLLTSSCVLEWSRLHSLDTRLPGRAGGVIGDVMGPLVLTWLGPVGSALLCICLVVACASSVFAFSWGTVAHHIGGWLEARVVAYRERQEMAQDQEAGLRAAREREVGFAMAPDEIHRATSSPQFVKPEPANAHETVVVPDQPADVQRQAVDLDLPWDEPAMPTPQPSFSVATPAPAALRAPPLRIDPAMNAALPASDRVVKERQKPLFSDLPDSKLPQVALLDGPLVWQETVSPETLEMTSRLIEKKLKDFGVTVRVVAASPGPVITRYEIEPAVGVKGSQVVNLAKDLARSLSLVSIRVVETVPGKNIMALELPNAKRQTIRLSEILGSQVYSDAKSVLTMGLGKDIVGNPVVVDLAKMPHCLVAGTTGSGKSVGINAMILSLLYKAEAKDVRLLLIDPKMLEMSVYEDVPHLLAPVVTDMTKAAHGLNWCVNEMERRYRLMSKMGVRNLAGFNTKIDEAKARGVAIKNPFSLTPEEPEPLDRLPTIVVVIDELADLMMVIGKKIEELIARLAQKARAAGIHLILATQRPSVDVITGLIKANIPTRLSFQVSSKIDSRTILDQMGAEALLGMGDMLYLPVGAGIPARVHGAFVSDEEVHRVVAYLKTQGEPNYIEGVLEGGAIDGEDGGTAGVGQGSGGESDALYDRAVDIVLKNQKASISLVQRHLGIGYNKAANLLEAMEKAGLVSTMNARGAREILSPSGS